MCLINRKHIYVALCIILTISVLVGCTSTNQSQNQNQAQDVFSPSIPITDDLSSVYHARYIPLPTDIGKITNLACYGDKAYFVATVNVQGDEGNGFLSSEATVYSINLDGTGLTNLPGYTPPHIESEGTGSISQILAMTIDGEGNIWTIESWGIYDIELPANFDLDIVNPWSHIQFIETGSVIRKLDSTGAELESVDIHGTTGIDFFSIITVKMAVGEHIYISCTSRDTGNTVYVFDIASNILFEQRIDDWDAEFVRMPDGTMAIAAETKELLPIDISLGVFSEATEIPEDVVVVKFLDLSESRINIYSIINIIPLHDGRLVCLCKTNARLGQEFELVVFQENGLSETDEKIVISLAGINISEEIIAAAGRYNSLSHNYHIEVTDYEQHYDTVDAAYNRLTLDINTGNLPDILYCNDWIPFTDYANKGLFTDIYPFIDTDPDIDRSDLFQAPLKAAETDGHLYRAFSGFSIFTIVGNPSVLGTGMGWNLDEFEAVMDANPEADIPLGEGYRPINFFRNTVLASKNDFIDWETGSCNFDSPEFLQLLESANKIPGSNAPGISLQTSGDSEEEPFNVSNGRMIMKVDTVGHITDLLNYKRIFGEDFIFKGLPNRERNGHMLYNIQNPLAIIDSSLRKNAAWDFVRITLDKDWQLYYASGVETATGVFLLNQDAFEDGVNEYMKQDASMYQLPAQEDLDMAIELVNSVSTLWDFGDALINIISEEASDYFSGTKSAEETARIIQNRASTYLEERN